jgi:hypothetical protein
LDLIIGFSGLFAAFSILWILVALFGALILGALAASVFGGIFYGMSRLARKMTPAGED